MRFRKLCTLTVLSLAALAVPFTATAADYPDRPISVMVSYSPGGATDFQARIVTMMAGQEKYLGQPIVIVNRPGAGGQVGWNWFAEKAGTDGYRLAAYNVPHFIAQSIKFDTKYNINNLQPIANWGADPAVLIVPKNSRFDSATELVAYARRNPGKVTVSGAGLFVGHHIATLQLQKAADIELKYVPTKGGVNAMKMVVGSQVSAGFNNLSDSYRGRNNIKILAIADVQRNREFLPDVPTFKEQGIDVDDSSVNFRGIMATDGTPRRVVNLLAQKVEEMFSDPRVAKQMNIGGSPLRIMSRAEVQSMWRERQAYLSELLEGL